MIVSTISTFPLLVAYQGLTSVIVPKMLRSWTGIHVLDVGPLYYIYMAMLAIFMTNGINIYAGINGIEVGQSFIIGCFIMVHNIIVSTSSKILFCFRNSNFAYLKRSMQITFSHLQL
jgi:UDP-N-acetylglucosamine--dolichyl-phosphate N-acetylglucosaminephosphotransferase